MFTWGVLISQCTRVSTHHTVGLNTYNFLFVNCTSIKPGGGEKRLDSAHKAVFAPFWLVLVHIFKIALFFDNNSNMC